MHEYKMQSQSHCFGCNIAPEDMLRSAGAPKAGLSTNTLAAVRQEVRPSGSRARALREAGLEGDERRRDFDDEMWLIEELTCAALIAQRDLFVESLQREVHGTAQKLAKRISHDFRAAARWAPLFESGSVSAQAPLARMGVPGSTADWRRLREELEALALIFERQPETLASLADRSRGRGDRLGLDTVRNFKQSVAQALSERVPLRSPRAAKLFRLVYEDVLEKPLSDPRRELNRIRAQGK